MLWSKKDAVPEDATAREEKPGAKNRPTPKRKDQEAARKQPLVVTDRKVAKERDKVKRQEQMAKQRQAMITGDDAGLPVRDKGPEKRYIRDYVDARWSVGEFLLPVMLVVLALSFFGSKNPAILSLTFILVYGLILVAAIDVFLMWRRVKKRVMTKFGDDHVPSGAAMYTVMRAFQLRPTRMPKPQVKRGQYPS